jgi:energy-coupling factor transporter ATP-binding protein EcfA2
VISFEAVSFSYAEASRPTLLDVDLVIPDGELVLVTGRTGAGKSTLLRAVNGLVPHFTGGRLSGRVLVDGRDTRTSPPRELADVVGYVGQVPIDGFVTDTVEDELAYAMESLGIAAPVMRRRVEDIVDLLGLADLRDRPLGALSGGQQQRVAIGSVLTAGARVLVLDEPTSALDPPAAEDVLAALTRLVHDLGVTVLMAEHRLERVLQYADLVITMDGQGGVIAAGPAVAMRDSPVAPPVVQLGRFANWTPLPLSVRDARRAADGLRTELGSHTRPGRLELARAGVGSVVLMRKVVARYGDVVALGGIDLELATGEIVALMGRNGSGKSTLLSLLVGLGNPSTGQISVAGKDPAGLSAPELIGLVAMVPQQPGDLLYAETVDAELGFGGSPERAGKARRVLDQLAPGIEGGSHPRDLSEGQRLALALAIVVSGRPAVVLLDEPTRGLDYAGKERLAAVLRGLAADGAAVVLATHDVELAAEVCDRTIVLADGDIVADGPTASVVTASPVFAPQVAKIVAPLPWLTVNQVRRSLDGIGA